MVLDGAGSVKAGLEAGSDALRVELAHRQVLLSFKRSMIESSK